VTSELSFTWLYLLCS
jgi:hypothetical protein